MGIKQKVLIENCVSNGIPSDEYFYVWADAGLSEIIKAVDGVGSVVRCSPYDTKYMVGIDKRYSIEVVKAEINLAIIRRLEQPAPAEQDAEWVPAVGETVEVRGWGYADNVDRDWYSAKIVRISPVDGGNHTVIFVEGPNSGDKVQRSVEDGDMRRPSSKPAKKPFVFGERVHVDGRGDEIAIFHSYCGDTHCEIMLSGGMITLTTDIHKVHHIE